MVILQAGRQFYFKNVKNDQRKTKSPPIGNGNESKRGSEIVRNRQKNDKPNRKRAYSNIQRIRGEID